jgi:hypothetical protein
MLPETSARVAAVVQSLAGLVMPCVPVAYPSGSQGRAATFAPGQPYRDSMARDMHRPFGVSFTPSHEQEKK